MKDKIFMILLGIIAVNLTVQTVKDVGFFSEAHAQSSYHMQRGIANCFGGARLTSLTPGQTGGDSFFLVALQRFFGYNRY